MRHFKFFCERVFAFVRERSVAVSVLIGALSPWGQTNFLPSEYFLIPFAVLVLLHRLVTRQWTFHVHGSKQMKWIFATVILSCLGYAISDMVRGTDFGEAIKGQARFGVLFLDLLGLLALVECSWKNIPILLGTNAVFSCLVVAIYGPEGGKTDDFASLWKLGYALHVTYLTGLVVSFVKKPVGALMLLVLGIMHLSLENRAFGAATVLAGLLLYGPSMPKRFRVVSAVAAAVIGFSVIGFAYSYFKIGESSRSEGSDVNRTAMMSAGWNVFLDNPLAGQGSTLPYFNFHNTSFFNYYTAKRAEVMNDARAYSDETEEYILHSQVLTGLASGGLLGGAFYLYFAVVIGTSIWFCSTNEFPFRILLLLMLFRCAFEVIAGPVLTVTRFEIPMCLAPIVILSMVRNKPKPAARAAA